MLWAIQDDDLLPKITITEIMPLFVVYHSYYGA